MIEKQIDTEFLLVERVRRGDSQATSELLRIYEARTRSLAIKWNLDEQDVDTVVMKKLVYGIENYKKGRANFSWYLRPLIENGLRDIKGSARHRCNVSLSTILDHEDNGHKGYLSTEMNLVNVDFIQSYLSPHRAICQGIIYRTATVNIQQIFREFLNVRRSQKCITRSNLIGALADFGMPDPQGQPILQTSLFVDKYAGTLVDDYCLLGERILKCLSTGVAYPLVGEVISEPQKLVNRYKKHWVEVYELLNIKS